MNSENWWSWCLVSCSTSKPRSVQNPYVQLNRNAEPEKQTHPPPEQAKLTGTTEAGTSPSSMYLLIGHCSYTFLSYTIQLFTEQLTTVLHRFRSLLGLILDEPFFVGWELKCYNKSLIVVEVVNSYASIDLSIRKQHLVFCLLNTSPPSRLFHSTRLPPQHSPIHNEVQSEGHVYPERTGKEYSMQGKSQLWLGIQEGQNISQGEDLPWYL